MIRLVLSASFFIFVASVCFSQQVEKIRIDAKTVSAVQSPWKLVQIETQANLRGLCVPNDREIWASGSNGTVVHSYNAGRSWRVKQIEGAEELDFRDIEAIDEGTAVIMSAGSPGRIYRTTDGGSRWKLCYENKNPHVFFDAMAFWDQRFGIAMSDPIGGRLFLVGTADGGKTWKPLPTAKMPQLVLGEAGFAASGTNVCIVGEKGIVIALANGAETGKTSTSRIVYSPDRGNTWSSWDTPLPTNKTSGIFSVCFIDRKHGCVVGGNFKAPNDIRGNYAITKDGGATWSTAKPRKPPSGYRSCVAKLRHGKEVYLIAVGPNGTDLSSDIGGSWRKISNKGFHAVQFSPSGRTGWASGAKGQFARWVGSSDRPKSARK